MHWGEIRSADQPISIPISHVDVQHQKSSSKGKKATLPCQLCRYKFENSAPVNWMGILQKIFVEAEAIVHQRSQSLPLLGPVAQYVAQKWRQTATNTKDDPLEDHCKLTVICTARSEQKFFSLSANT